MKIRLEVSSLASNNTSGVANYTKLLTESLDKDKNIDVYASYFNFLNRQPIPRLSIKRLLEKNKLIPLRLYAKLQSYNIAAPFDILLPSVDLTIFPNFATWPTIKSKYRATVIHDLTYLYYPELVEEKNLKHLRRVVPRSIKESDFIITVSESVKSELVKEFKIVPDKCIVTTIPPDKKYSTVNNSEIHKRYNIPTEKFILFIGTLEPRKDLPTLINAYIKLPRSIKDIYSLVLVGGSGWKNKQSIDLIKLAQKNNEKIIQTGFIDSNHTSAFYQKASILVMPSLYEGFGMPILEAMSCNCPVIASDIPVLREAAGEAALFSTPKDSNSFKINIEKIIKNDKLRKSMIEKGKQQLDKFSWENNVQTIKNKAESLSIKH